MNERLKEIRKSKKVNLTQKEFGRRLGVKDTAISKLENGENTITDQMILAICREFNVNEEWLRTGEGGDGAMFDESDDSTVSSLVSELKLDDTAKIILLAYKRLNDKQRNGVRIFIENLSQSVLGENIKRAYSDVHHEIENFDGDIDELHDRFSGTFATEFSFIDFQNDIEENAVSEEAKLEQEKTALHAMLDEQLSKEKKQVTKVSSAKESDAG